MMYLTFVEMLGGFAVFSFFFTCVGGTSLLSVLTIAGIADALLTAMINILYT